jgi:hypothetical protein
MLRFSILPIALLIDLAITTGAEMSGCSRVSNLSTARLSGAAVRKDHVDPPHSEENGSEENGSEENGSEENGSEENGSEENGRSYATNFFEAVTARQAAFFCKDGIEGNGFSNYSTSRSRLLTVLSRQCEPIMTCKRFIGTRATTTEAGATGA